MDFYDIHHRIKPYFVRKTIVYAYAMLNCVDLSITMDHLMIETLLQAILQQVEQPKKDIEHNVRALLNEAVTKMDLVSKEEIERQRTALNQANQRLNDLIKQVESLEQRVLNKK